MNAAEQAEALLKEHLGVGPPWDRPWKLRAFEYVLEHMPEVAAFRDQGMALIQDPGRRELIEKYIGQQNGHEHRDYGFNVWVLNQCIGERSMSPNEIFMRCLSCFKVRTSSGMSQGPCRCGGNRMSNCVGDMNTRKALAHLVMGY